MLNRRELFALGLAGGLTAGCDRLQAPRSTGPGKPPAPAFELDEKTIGDLQNDMASGRRTARSIAEAYLARIGEIDKQGPALNSVIEINPDAISIAQALDEERRSRGPRGPLHGIPLLIKDNIDTSDRMATSAGSLALERSIARRDAAVAERLRAAGAVILGKTNLSEWANFRSALSTSGWSARGGLTRNPYALDRNACGSSSGSGVAVSANLCAGAIGTETDGSIVCPSNVNGIVGIKPTVGLVSRAGIIPLSHTQDTAGPMARTVADAAVLLGAIAGADPRDNATAENAGKAPADYTRFLDGDGLRGARLGVARRYAGFLDAVDRLMDQAIDAMRGAGAVIVDPIELDDARGYEQAELQVLLYEFKHNINQYLSGLDPRIPYRSLADIIRFNEQNRSREMPYFNQELFVRANAKGSLASPEYVEALETCRRLSRDRGIDAAIGKDRLDAIVAPTGGPAWTTDLARGDRFAGSSSTPAAVAGYPNINVPMGFVGVLPVGISFFGAAYAEPVLIRLAYAFEQRTRHRRAPRFLPGQSRDG